MINLQFHHKARDLYKTRDFNFSVIKFPHSDSCTHSSLMYLCFHTQLVRFMRICNHRDDFVLNAKLVYKELIIKGANKLKLDATFLRFAAQYEMNLAKYDLWDKKQLLTKIFQPLTST